MQRRQKPRMSIGRADEGRPCALHGHVRHGPDAQGEATNSGLCRLARQWGLTPAQAALGWLLAKPAVIVIPKTSSRERLKENLAALRHPLTPEQLSELDRLFPPPSGPAPLEML